MVVRKSVFTAGGYAVGERGRKDIKKRRYKKISKRKDILKRISRYKKTRAVEDHGFYDVCIIHSNSHGKLFYNHLHRKD
jgi:hypothetical protein